jgi:hypothetical protein
MYKNILITFHTLSWFKEILRSGVLLSYEEERYYVIWWKIDGSGDYHVKW